MSGVVGEPEPALDPVVEVERHAVGGDRGTTAARSPRARAVVGRRGVPARLSSVK